MENLFTGNVCECTDWINTEDQIAIFSSEILYKNAVIWKNPQGNFLVLDVDNLDPRIIAALVLDMKNNGIQIIAPDLLLGSTPKEIGDLYVAEESLVPYPTNLLDTDNNPALEAPLAKSFKISID